MRLRVLPEIGGARLSDVHRPDAQALVDRLLAEGLSASTVRCTALPLRAIVRRAVSRGELAINPCDGIELPGSEAEAEAAGLLDAYLEAQLRQAADVARGAGEDLTGAQSGARSISEREKAHG